MRSPQQAPEIPGHTYVRLISNKGGFGDVYLFVEVALHRSVAIKVIRSPPPTHRPVRAHPDRKSVV